MTLHSGWILRMPVYQNRCDGRVNARGVIYGGWGVKIETTAQSTLR